MKWLAAALAVAVILLQYRVWISADGVREVERLKRAVATQRADNEQLAERNRQLAAEVRDLKTGMDALEEPARRTHRDRMGARALSRGCALRAYCRGAGAGG